jgi:hypothetical protein
MQTSFNAPMQSNAYTPSSGTPTGFNGTSQQDFNQQPISVTVGFGGKMAPPAAPQPLL